MLARDVLEALVFALVADMLEVEYAFALVVVLFRLQMLALEMLVDV